MNFNWPVSKLCPYRLAMIMNCFRIKKAAKLCGRLPLSQTLRLKSYLPDFYYFSMTKRKSTDSLYQPKMSECIYDGLFLLRRADWNLTFTGSRVVVLTLLKPDLILYLSDIKSRYFEAILIKNPLFDVLICRLFRRSIFPLIKGDSIHINLY